jgi:hypothetical protein
MPYYNMANEYEKLGVQVHVNSSPTLATAYFIIFKIYVMLQYGQRI